MLHKMLKRHFERPWIWKIMYCRISLGHHSHYVTSEGMFFQIENVKIQTVPTTNCKKVFFKDKQLLNIDLKKNIFDVPFKTKL